MMTAPTSNPTKPKRSSSYGSSDDDSNGIPEMIACASFQSESDNDSLSSSTRSLNRGQSPTLLPRSIFGSYWSSPMHKKNLEEINGNGEDEAMARLRTLQVSSVNGNDDTDVEFSSNWAVEPKTKKSFDDASIDYQAALASDAPTSTPRRKILPTPPPPTAISSSLIQPKRRPHFLLSPLGGEKKCFSTTTLLKRLPYQSCLRKSRYSCSAIVTHSEVVSVRRLHHGLRNNGYQDLHHQGVSLAASSRDKRPNDLRDEFKKSVSFYSQVSVFEFAVPQIQRSSQKVWSSYFA